jgi:hypothetical protein
VKKVVALVPALHPLSVWWRALDLRTLWLEGSIPCLPLAKPALDSSYLKLGCAAARVRELFARPFRHS